MNKGKGPVLTVDALIEDEKGRLLLIQRGVEVQQQLAEAQGSAQADDPIAKAWLQSQFERVGEIAIEPPPENGNRFEPGDGAHHDLAVLDHITHVAETALLLPVGDGHTRSRRRSPDTAAARSAGAEAGAAAVRETDRGGDERSSDA